MARFLLALSFCISMSAAFGANLNTVVMPAARLATIKAALPKVSYAKLNEILAAPETLWYDHTTMKPSYQDSVGASSNDKWPDLVAAPESIIGDLHDRKTKRWQFPFAATAGTDASTNIVKTNFIYLPQKNGEVPTMQITKVILNDNRPEWRWKYPVGTVVGEIIFIKDGTSILPTEIRTRTRHEKGWAMNAFRPFPRALDLAEAIRTLRPKWDTNPSLRNLVEHLQDWTTLEPARLAAKGKFAPTFQQEGFIDVLPEFGDDALVRELLTKTIFRSAYGATWKKNGAQRTYAASTKSLLSIVPNNYMAGLLEVNDASCMRCHQDTNRLVSEFHFELYLYGELWGMDGIFSFHPYDESRYPDLRLEMIDNRSVNPKLRQAKVFATKFREETK